MRLVRVLLPLVACDALELVSLFLEELVDLLLVFDYSLRDNLAMLYDSPIL